MEHYSLYEDMNIKKCRCCEEDLSLPIHGECREKLERKKKFPKFTDGFIDYLVTIDKEPYE